MKYATEINDASRYGITAARAAYNAALPAEVQVSPADGDTPAVMGPNPDLISTDEGYLDFVLQRAVQSWCQQYAPVVTAPVPETVVAGVPQQVTRRQAKTVMELTPDNAHGNLWNAALAAASAIPDPQVRVVTTNYLMESLYFEYAQVLAMAHQLLGMTSAQVDALFVAASKL